jgi:hypothetical protein
MSKDLHVALCLWCNAYDNACRADRNYSDQARIRELPAIISELSQRSDDLFRIAEVEVEADITPAGAPETVIDGHVLPTGDAIVALMKALIAWDAASVALDDDADHPSRICDRIIREEERIRRLLKGLRVLEQRPKSRSRAKPKKEEV